MGGGRQRPAISVRYAVARRALGSGLGALTPRRFGVEEQIMNAHRVGVVLIAGAMSSAAFLVSTLQARQAGDRPVFQSIQVFLEVADLNRSADFYKTVLEFGPADVLASPGLAMFTVGGQYLGFRQAQKDGPRSTGLRLVVRVDNSRAYLARIRGRGVTADVDFVDRTGQPSFTVLDPDGNRFYFTGNLRVADLAPTR
jgi:predicted enzyme related to lactoylglutathione lyase